MINLQQFRALVVQYLGPELHDATPDNVRAFLDRMQVEMAEKPPPGERYRIEESIFTYDSILRDFFWSALNSPLDEAVIMLWVLAAEAYLTESSAAAPE